MKSKARKAGGDSSAAGSVSGSVRSLTTSIFNGLGGMSGSSRAPSVVGGGDDPDDEHWDASSQISRASSAVSKQSLPRVPSFLGK
jgi:hypothetical protein